MFWTRRIVRRKMCKKRKYFLTFFLLCLPALSDQKCWQTYMHGQQTKDYRLEGFQLKALHTRTLFTCFQMCLKLDTCESLNFATDAGVCELNRKRVSKSSCLIYRPGYIFVQALFEKGPLTMGLHDYYWQPSSCAKILQRSPSAASGYYWIHIGPVKFKVYCDMKAFGGGWTLVVSISSKNNDYHQRTAINCWDSELCVSFNKDNMTTRKLSDEHIRHFASCEGTFRLDVFQGDYTVFYKIPQRSEQFDSACRGGNECHRLIISHHYPYKWETNNCTSLDVGYRIFLSSHYRVFDSHDDGECGALFRSSLYGSQRGLYGYTARDNIGIFLNKEGMLYVK